MKHAFICYCWIWFIACSNTVNKQLPNDKAQIGATNAMQILAASVQLYPDSIQLIQQYIELLDSAREYKKAMSQNDRLIQNDSLNHVLWYRKAFFSERLHDTLSAIKYYRFSVTCYATPIALLSLANLLAEQKNADALILCKNTSTLFPAKELKADLYFIKGIYHARCGNIKKANSMFDSCITSKYSYLEAYMEQGFILFDKAQIDKAFLLFETTTKLTPTYADGYYWMAKCKQKINERAQAINYYQKALTFDPTLKEAAEAILQLQ